MMEVDVGKSRISNTAEPSLYRSLALEYYRAARAEAVQRLALREQVLLASLTVSGVLAGFAFKSNSSESDRWLLILIAFIVLPFTVALVRHDHISALLDEYIRLELNPFLDLPQEVTHNSGVQEDRHKAPRHWDFSLYLGEELGRFLRVEKVVHIALLCLPAVAALVALPFILHGIHGKGARILYVFGCLSTLFSIMLLTSYKLRDLLFGPPHVQEEKMPVPHDQI